MGCLLKAKKPKVWPCGTVPRLAWLGWPHSGQASSGLSLVSSCSHPGSRNSVEVGGSAQGGGVVRTEAGEQGKGQGLGLRGKYGVEGTKGKTGVF